METAGHDPAVVRCKSSRRSRLGEHLVDVVPVDEVVDVGEMLSVKSIDRNRTVHTKRLDMRAGLGDLIRVAVEAMLTIPADDISRETVTAAIQGVQNFESDMLCRPWAFGDADAPSRLANRAGWMVELTDGAWNVLSDCVDVDPRVIQ